MTNLTFTGGRTVGNRGAAICSRGTLTIDGCTFTGNVSNFEGGAVHGLPSNGSQDLANPSGDSVPNLLKFAFNMAPNAGDLLVPDLALLPPGEAAGLPLVTRDNQGRLSIAFVRRKAGTNPGITYQALTGADLTNLQPLALTGATIASIDTTWERVTVIDPAVTDKRFGRGRGQTNTP